MFWWRSGNNPQQHSQAMQRNCLFNVLKICESLISYALSLSICCYPELETGY